jgi:8-oxo-dGTP pyrophosphatase MutT (NUDIX family)
MKMPDGTDNALLRIAEGVFVRESRNRLILGAHWSPKAAAEGEGNMTTVAGKWFLEETLEAALKRRAREEYGLEDAIEVTPLNHRRFIYPEKGKEYHWALVKYGGSREILPNERHVESFGWYDGVPALRALLGQMHKEKALMLLTVLRLAMTIEPRLARYKPAIPPQLEPERSKK